MKKTTLAVFAAVILSATAIAQSAHSMALLPSVAEAPTADPAPHPPKGVGYLRCIEERPAAQC